MTLLLLAGCGMKPDHAALEDVTVEKAISALRLYALSISDFKGSALVRVSGEGAGSGQSVGLSIRYKKPDMFRIVAKAFAGLPVAVMTADADSVLVFFPSENAVVNAPRSDGALRRVLPGFGFGIDKLTSVLTGYLPPDEDMSSFRASVVNRGDRVELVLDGPDESRRLTLEGADLHVTEEVIVRDDAIVWRLEAAGFRETDAGISFPRRVTVESAGGAVQVEFSDTSFNTGLVEGDLIFTPPPGARNVPVPL